MFLNGCVRAYYYKQPQFMFYGMTKKFWNENSRKNGKLATSSDELASVLEVEVLASFLFSK